MKRQPSHRSNPKILHIFHGLKKMGIIKSDWSISFVK